MIFSFSALRSMQRKRAKWIWRTNRSMSEIGNVIRSHCYAFKLNCAIFAATMKGTFLLLLLFSVFFFLFFFVFFSKTNCAIMDESVRIADNSWVRASITDHADHTHTSALATFTHPFIMPMPICISVATRILTTTTTTRQVAVELIAPCLFLHMYHSYRSTLSPFTMDLFSKGNICIILVNAMDRHYCPHHTLHLPNGF